MLSKLLRASGVFGATALFAFGAICSPSLAEDKSLIEKATGAPDWLTIRGSQRTRFEVLNGPGTFGALVSTNRNGDVETRNFSNGTMDLVSLQTALFIEARLGKVRLVVEAMDSRSYKAIVSDSFGNILADNNALEPIQAYAALNLGHIAGANQAEILVGRFTMNLGSGRLVARSKFRNTIQSYHGVRANISPTGDDNLTLFYTLPYSRRPNDGNKLRYDTPERNQHFWGAHYETPNILRGAIVEAYLYGRYGDSPGSLSGLQFTPGVRLYRSPQENSFDFDIEAAAQIRNNAFNGRGNQRAGFFSHAELGYTPGSNKKIRIAGLLDVASGSEDKLDLETNQINSPSFGPISFTRATFAGANAFDPLFGDFSKDFGPEGLFGLLARTNIISPAVRLEYAPSSRFETRLTYRAARQLEPEVIFFSIFQVDAFGNPSNIIIPRRHFSGWGHQIDTRARYWIVPKRLQVELGGAFFTQRGSIDPVPELGVLGIERDRSNTFYGYSSITANF
jgi:Alginate export